MVYPGSIYSMLMSNREAADFVNGLPEEHRKEILDMEFTSSQALYDYITQLRSQP